MSSTPRTDGFYRSDAVTDDGTPYRYWLRFFPDGTVVGSSVLEVAEVEDVSRWLTADHEDRGRFEHDACGVRFTLTSPSGSVDYEGTTTANADALDLRSHSRINGYDDETILRFVPARDAK